MALALTKFAAADCPLPFGKEGSTGIVWREVRIAPAAAAETAAEPAANTETATEPKSDGETEIEPAMLQTGIEGEESESEDTRDLDLQDDDDGNQSEDSFMDMSVTEEEAALIYNQRLLELKDAAAILDTDVEKEKSSEEVFSTLLGLLEDDFKGYIVSRTSITESEVSKELIGHAVMIREDETDSWVLRFIQSLGTSRTKWNFKVDKSSRERVTTNVFFIASTYGVDNTSRWVLVEKKE